MGKEYVFMSKEYRLENDLMIKSRPKFGSKRWWRLHNAGGIGFAKCDNCGAFLFNPQSILIHQGKGCQKKIENT